MSKILLRILRWPKHLGEVSTRWLGCLASPLLVWAKHTGGQVRGLWAMAVATPGRWARLLWATIGTRWKYARLRWHILSFSQKIRLAGLLAAAVALISLTIAYSLREQPSATFWLGLLTNVGTELLGIAATVLLVNDLYERAQQEQLKARLIREMRSRIRDVAVPAAEEMRDQGWGFGEDRSLVGVRLREANLQGAELEGVNLERANLERVNLQGANLERANLQETGLLQANLEGAWLPAANLRGAYLLLANLERAVLLVANLEGAAMWRANLCGAVLLGAELYGSNLQGARYDHRTKWPDGFDPAAAGAINVDRTTNATTASELAAPEEAVHAEDETA